MAKHGRYKIVRKVADGGMAEIFLATQLGREGFQKPVILKRIHSSIYADPQFRNMFLDEAHISMGLSHSNIVQILDLGVGAGRYFLVMEAVDGWDLGRVLYRAATVGTPFPRDLGLHVAAEVCRALAYAHGKMDASGERPLGIVHRDVSPQNILLSEQGEVKLTDFGIAKAMNKREHTGTGVVKGKVAFMSPEQALGKPIDARSDLFAVGTVLYQLMTRVRPFEAATDLEVLLRVQHGEFKPAHVVAPDLPAEVSSIIARSMQLDPDLRFQSADEMLTAIENVLRTVFRPVGQTELKRWLAGLGARDGQAPMSKAVMTPPPGRVTTGERGLGTGEMEGKDVELTDSQGEVDAEEATSLASLDGPGGEMRPRMTRQRVEELTLPVPSDGESALSGRHAPLEFGALSDGDERPGRRRARRGSGTTIAIVGLLILGGAAFAGRHFGLLRELKEELSPASAMLPGAPQTPATKPDEAKPGEAKPDEAKSEAKSDEAKPDEAKTNEPSKRAVEKRNAADPAVSAEGTSHKTNEGEPTREPGGHKAHGGSAEKAEKSESARRIEALKNQMAPDPSLEPAPSAPAPAAPPPAPTAPENP
ncbi:MAG: pkn6 [Myxococcales bacterium]|nr:pkn6 [Myxococcales bacterium]